VKNKVALQLYTVREECQADFFGTLKKIKAAGYAGVQFAGFYGYEPQEIKTVLDKLDLKAAGLHVGYAAIKEETAMLVEAAKIVGTKDLIVPSLPKELQNEDGYRQVKQDLQKIAEQLKSEDIRISYHNHAFEFATEVDHQDALAYLLNPAGSPDVYAEIDVFWVQKAGHDPLDYIQAYANRMPIIHLKDMSDDEERYDVPIGTGVIDFTPILEWGEQSDVEWYVVEQDRCRFDAIESITLSYKNLSKLIDQLKNKENVVHE